MPTVADYTILADDGPALGDDGFRVFDFSLPTNLRAAESGNRAVASWRLTVENPENLKYRLEINDTEIQTYTHNVESFGTVQEVFRSSILAPGANTARIQVFGGRGRIRVTDFVLHFQVDI